MAQQLQAWQRHPDTGVRAFVFPITHMMCVWVPKIQREYSPKALRSSPRHTANHFLTHAVSNNNNIIIIISRHSCTHSHDHLHHLPSPIRLASLQIDGDVFVGEWKDDKRLHGKLEFNRLLKNEYVGDLDEVG